MRIEVHNGDLYDRLLRILDRDELHTIVRDALMHAFLHLFTHPEFITSPNHAERFGVVLKNLDSYIRRFAYEVLKDNPTMRKGFFLFRWRRTRKIVYELMDVLDRHVWRAFAGEHFFRLLRYATIKDYVLGGVSSRFLSYVDENGHLVLY